MQKAAAEENFAIQTINNRCLRLGRKKLQLFSSLHLQLLLHTLLWKSDFPEYMLSSEI